MNKSQLLFIVFLSMVSSFAQYTPNDRGLLLTTFNREFNEQIISEYLNSDEPAKINAALLSIANSGDSLLAVKLIKRDYLINNEFMDFALRQTGIIKKEYKQEELLNKLQSEQNNFEYAFRLYRMSEIPGDKLIYVNALKKALAKKDIRTIPYLLGCLRKLKYFPDDDKIASSVINLNTFDLKIEAVKVFPYYIKNEYALYKYLNYFNDKNQNIVRQASVSISEIKGSYLQKKISDFIKEKIKSLNVSNLIKNELLLSYVKLNKSSFEEIRNVFKGNINNRGWIQAAQSIGDKESKDILFMIYEKGNYHEKLFSIIALDELNKDSSLTAKINELKTSNRLLLELLNESARPRADFEKIWDYAFKYKTAEIITTKGKIKLKFLSEYAPLSVGNFCMLALQKFFDGNLFYRVVPGFVIQTGDTSNTGWGGPDHSITSEVSPITYDKGILGMASSGKDTEGSQWFITTGNYPHLDGRYSVFGKVISGQNIADRITQEDKIIAVKIYR